MRYGYVVIIFSVFFGLAYGLLNLAQSANEVDKNSLTTKSWVVLAGLMKRDKDGPSGNLFRETYKSDNCLELLYESPFGVGFGSESKSGELKSGNALLFGSLPGIPAVVVLLLMFTYIFLVFCHPLLISINPVFNTISASFIGHAITNLSYGNWIAPYFLLHLALVVICSNRARQI